MSSSLSVSGSDRDGTLIFNGPAMITAINNNHVISNNEPSTSANVEKIRGPLLVRVLSLDVSLEDSQSREGLGSYSSLIYPDIQLSKVPIMRIFGISESGQKCLVNMHQVYPYLYIKCDDPQVQWSDSSQLMEYCRSLALSINKALSHSLNRSTDPAKSQFVFAIVPVRAYDFYGYTKQMGLFLKVYILDPGVMSRLADLMAAGAVMSRRFQCYEAHIPFILQFMIDHDLYGMGYMRLRDYKLRIPILNRSSNHNNNVDNRDGYLTEMNVPEERKWTVRDNVIRSSTCELEVDSWPWFIENRLDVEERILEPNVPVLNRAEKLVSSLESMWQFIRNSDGYNGILGDDDRRVNNTAQLPQTLYQQRVQQSISEMIERNKNTEGDLQRSEDEFSQDIPTLTQAIGALYPPLIDSNEDEDILEQASQHSAHSSLHISSLPFHLLSTEIFDISADDETTVVINHDVIASQTEIFDKSMRDGAEYETDSDEGEQGDTEEILDDLWEDDEAWDVFLNHQHTGESNLDVLLNQMTQKSSPETPARMNPVVSSSDNSSPLKHAERSESVKVDDVPEPVPIEIIGVQETANPLLKRILRKLSTAIPNNPLEPAPTNVIKETFISKLDGQWSPISEQMGKRDFFDSPPRPISPNHEFQIVIDEVQYEETVAVVPSPQTEKCSSAEKMTNSEHDAHMVIEIDSSQSQEPETDILVVQSKLIAPRENGIGYIKYQEPFYSNEKDIPKSVTINSAGRRTCVRGNEKPIEKEFTKTAETIDLTTTQSSQEIDHEHHTVNGKFKYLKSDLVPPTRLMLRQEMMDKKKPKQETSSQIQMPTRDTFKLPSYNSPTGTDSASKDSQYHMTVCSMEIFTSTRHDLSPDPKHDGLKAIFYCIFNTNDDDLSAAEKGIFQINDTGRTATSYMGTKIHQVRDEMELFYLFIEFVIDRDPDILCGWDVHKSSWGFVIERAASRFDFDIASRMSRIHNSRNSFFTTSNKQDDWGMRKSSGIHVCGRIVLNVWRLMRSEFALTHYTYENLVYHVLHQRVPKFSYQTLTKWYHANSRVYRWRVMRYMLERTVNCIQIMDKCNLIIKTIEFAKMFGVEFTSVITRGSQFKVESMMIRIAHPENFVMISPTREQVSRMTALEAIPLVMEPESKLYNSPVIVLDFQSLYPSIMIGYNLCFSTCIGKLFPNPRDTLGFREHSIDFEQLKEVLEDITVTPNGVVFVKPHVRQSVLRRMLSELLDTRVMAKKLMKNISKGRRAYRVWDSRQLAIKFVSNVTYGYTSASFSGRMPCVEVADSIVQIGRATLEAAIKKINSTAKWNAKVVYADTDSTFISLPGRSKEDAFKIGHEIADTITSMNPAPMKLKFEKVYHPCILMSKKRYVGFKYETVQQLEPDFDAKGIETVRRDGCPAVSKILENCLKHLFRHKDLSKIKEYVQDEFTKIMAGSASIQDFIIAKEVKLGNYSENGLPPPGAYISLDKMKKDPRSEPNYGERVPFVISDKGPQSRLVDSAKDPLGFVMDKYVQIDSTYYITRQIIPVLARVFDLIGVDVKKWYDEMPKISKSLLNRNDLDSWNPPLLPHKATNAVVRLESFYRVKNCVNCKGTISGNNPTARTDILCPACESYALRTLIHLHNKASAVERKVIDIQQICHNCISASGGPDIIEECLSIDCPTFYERIKTAKLHIYWQSILDKVSSAF